LTWRQYHIDNCWRREYEVAMDGITADEIGARIREIVDYGEIRFSDHVSRKMNERNYNIRDIIHSLRNGKILKFIKQKDEEYHCEVHGEDLDGYRGAVLAIVIKNVKMVIVTVLGGV
jgi:hypothetical protein